MRRFNRLHCLHNASIAAESGSGASRIIDSILFRQPTNTPPTPSFHPSVSESPPASALYSFAPTSRSPAVGLFVSSPQQVSLSRNHASSSSSHPQTLPVSSLYSPGTSACAISVPVTPRHTTPSTPAGLYRVVLLPHSYFILAGRRSINSFSLMDSV